MGWCLVLKMCTIRGPLVPASNGCRRDPGDMRAPLGAPPIPPAVPWWNIPAFFLPGWPAASFLGQIQGQICQGMEMAGRPPPLGLSGLRHPQWKGVTEPVPGHRWAGGPGSNGSQPRRRANAVGQAGGQKRSHPPPPCTMGWASLRERIRAPNCGPQRPAGADWQLVLLNCSGTPPPPHPPEGTILCRAWHRRNPVRGGGGGYLHIPA